MRRRRAAGAGAHGIGREHRATHRDRLPFAFAGALLWGAAGGVLDSTIKALVADLVPASRLATAYGLFAAVQGAAAVAGGVMAGALYERSLPILIAAVVVTQIIALGLLIATLRRHHKIRTEAVSGAA